MQLNITSLRRSVVSHSLKDFCHTFWPVVVPDQPILWNWHLDRIATELESITRGEKKRLIINVPPGTGKSLLVSVMWPAWEWSSNPSLRYLTAAYTDDNTIRDNLNVRSIVTSDTHQRTFINRDTNRPVVELSSDQYAKVRFNTDSKGFRIASSVGGVGTGEHPDRIIIDDPHKAKDVLSKVMRDQAHDWFKGTISTRKARDPAIVIIMQRLHEDDLCGRLLSRGGWEHICFPMRYEVSGSWDCPCHKVPDYRDPRTYEGELLFPQLWPESKVVEEERDMGGELLAAGQLQQRPRALSGGLFKRDFFRYVDRADLPQDRRRCRGWDAAATEAGGDRTAGILISSHDGKYFVEHEEVCQVEDNDRVIISIARMDTTDTAIREEQEPGSSGKKVIAYHAKMLAGYDYEGVTITGSKVARAKPFRAQCQAGNVFIVRGDWNEDYLDEMCSFPLGKYDDRVDGSSCAFNCLALEDEPMYGGLWGQ